MELPIGGYFSLEVNDGWERHHRALRLNAYRHESSQVHTKSIG